MATKTSKAAAPEAGAAANKTEEPKATAPNAETASDEIVVVSEAVNAQLEEKDARIAELEGDLSAANAELATKTSRVDELEEELAAKEAQIENQAIILKTLEGKVVGAGKSKKAKPETNAEEAAHFEHKGKKYAFTERAPKRISFDGKLYRQAELLNHEEHMTSLIVGESAFIKQVF